MIAILNIVLAALGFGVALAPIGGETWNKYEPKLLKRISKRGWIAIILLTLSLCVTVYKEIETSRREKTNDTKWQNFELGLNYLAQDFQSVSNKLEMLNNSNGKTDKNEQGFVDLKNDIQRYQRELLTLRNTLPAENNPNGQKKFLHNQTQGHKSQSADEYHEISKPIMEVK